LYVWGVAVLLTLVSHFDQLLASS